MSSTFWLIFQKGKHLKKDTPVYFNPHKKVTGCNSVYFIWHEGSR